MTSILVTRYEIRSGYGPDYCCFSFLFMYMLVHVLFSFFKLRKSIKTLNNILKLPDLCFRLSCSSFFTPFLVKDGVLV